MEASGQDTPLAGLRSSASISPSFPGVVVQTPRVQVSASPLTALCAGLCLAQVSPLCEGLLPPSLWKSASLCPLGVCRCLYTFLCRCQCASLTHPVWLCVCTHLCQLASEFLCCLAFPMGMCPSLSPLLMCVHAPPFPPVGTCVCKSLGMRVCVYLSPL